MLTEKRSGAAPVAHTPPSSRVLYGFLGHVGKGNLPVKRTFSCLIVIPLFVASCALPARVSRNIGTGETLPLTDRGTMGWSRHAGRSLVRTDHDRTDVRRFRYIWLRSVPEHGGHSGDGSEGKVGGDADPIGRNNQTLSLRFEGEATTDSEGKPAITGALVSGRCRWHVVLIRGRAPFPSGREKAPETGREPPGLPGPNSRILTQAPAQPVTN